MFMIQVNGRYGPTFQTRKEAVKLAAEHKRYQNLGVKLGYSRYPTDVQVIDLSKD